MGKNKRTCVLLGIREQEREIQNAQPGVVDVIKVQRQKDICMGKSQKDMCPFSYWSVVNVIKVRTYVWAKAKRTCVRLSIGGQESEIQNAQVNFIKVRRQKKSDLWKRKLYQGSIKDCL